MGAKPNKEALMDQPAAAGASVEGATPAKVKEPKAPKVKAKIGYKFLRDIDPATDKFNNQQTVLMDAMCRLADKDGVVSREQLLTEVTMETLKSRQPAERVFGFYLNGWKKDVTKGEGDKARTIKALLAPVQLA
jgi:hypothetical protein